MSKLLALALCLAASAAGAQPCPWMSASRLDQAFPDRAPWTVLVGGQGRCKFLSSGKSPASTIGLTQIVEASAEEAERYVKAVGGGMAKTYRVTSLPEIGMAGVAVRENGVKDSRMLTLIGHRKKIVVMAQLSFYGGVDETQQSAAVALTLETFALDTGGGLQMPKP